MYKGVIFLKISRELLKGSTNMLVLSLLENENMYGYQMIKKLSERSQNVFELQEGTLYPILHSLEEKNYITSYWDNTGAKKRKYYSITKEGKKHLREKKDEWRTFSNGINQVVGGVLFGY
jgi:PadR family transcriptional regulator PadR